ncbi:MAG TPA: class I SAM-dependent methyltransferase [Allosphingosinicella sp.]|jgi:SAM-dependent methyltransferase
MARLALEMLAPQPGERVLEVGFGGGGLLAALIRAGAVTVGIDISDAAVARARRRFPDVEIHLAAAERVPLADGSVSKAVSLNSLYFWPDPAAAFAELARVTAPGGRLVLGFEPPEELRKWPGHRHGFRLFEVEEVKGLMRQAGFDEIEEKWGRGRKPDLFCCLSGTRIGANR